MKPTIQSIHFDADKKLITFIEEKLSKLTQFHEKIIGMDVILKLNKSDDNANKMVEIKLHVSGKELFASRQCATFEEAVDLATDALRSQLIKQKAKRSGD
jgi:putative sigma-54 modulation protein